ncbi:peptide chain release factor N(5)-glutamine methyltransferase [Roseiflexus castenholzii]|uniref:Release factor glutamine methyltransferase n=1 Tax=Roseiflexus castenholzii (strain DSM 13941 / HLO8) TaxID=383372 RepID=A7NJ13_ROSCS|nr:peptide chain release factor N(5)-glutamine methyltransferase [Roseiflexus castenholzii]ABU57479.1 modification methylase, HemK family [Roseiflexus castenholzii DSM 13941]
MTPPNAQATLAQALASAVEALREVSSTPRLDAEILLAHTLGWSRARVLARLQETIPDDALQTFRALVERRAAREPVAYLTGRKEFYGLEFVVDRRVLVPRPETEALVDAALEWARQHYSPHDTLLIADIGTGSGCIAIVLARHLPNAVVYATDLSPDALAVARQNAELHGVAERITLLCGDLLAPLPQAVDLAVSNPPYTILNEIDAGVRLHEPHLALDGGSDGLAVYRRLLATAPQALRPGGALMLEIGATQAEAVTALARQAFPAAAVHMLRDLAGWDRVVVVNVER